MPDFDEAFYQEVIRLEDKIQQKDYSIQEISELVSFYSRCIEKYDRQNDSISTYFLDKIRSTIVLQSTFDKLFDENSADQKQQNDDMARTKINYIESVKKSNNPNQDVRDKKKEQTKKFLMMVELKKNQKKVDINKVIDDFEMLRQDNKRIMYGDLEDQVMALKTNIEKGIQPQEQMQLNERMRSVVNSVQRMSLSRSTFFVNPLIVQQDIQREHVRQSQQMRGGRMTQSGIAMYNSTNSPMRDARPAWQDRNTHIRAQIIEDVEEEFNNITSNRSELKRSNILEDLANESFQQ